MALLVGELLLGVSCSASGDRSIGIGAKAAAAGSSGAHQSQASNGAAGSVLLDLGGSSASDGSSPPGNASLEVCDGIDNDQNGMVDDVDVGHDGLCDCLNIATIGHIGSSSNGGNIFASWLNSRSPLGAVALDDQELSPEILRKFQIVIVLHVATFSASGAPAHHAFSDAESSAFDAWVRGGGGAMTTIGYSGDEAKEVVNVNQLLGRLGMGYSTTKLELDGFVQSWEKHPVTDGVSNIFTDNGVEPDGPLGLTLARAVDRVALQVTQADRGRIAVWGDEWITYDSQWVDAKSQQVELFWLKLLKWLTPPTQCQVPIPPRVK